MTNTSIHWKQQLILVEIFFSQKKSFETSKPKCILANLRPLDYEYIVRFDVKCFVGRIFSSTFFSMLCPSEITLEHDSGRSILQIYVKKFENKLSARNSTLCS